MGSSDELEQLLSHAESEDQKQLIRRAFILGGRSSLTDAYAGELTLLQLDKIEAVFVAIKELSDDDCIAGLSGAGGTVLAALSNEIDLSMQEIRNNTRLNAGVA